MICETNNWVRHDGGACPIPWAKAGEFEVMFSKNCVAAVFPTQGGFKLSCDAKDSMDWGMYGAYRLTDGWIPVFAGGVPAHPKGWIKFKSADGEVSEFKVAEKDRFKGCETHRRNKCIVAYRIFQDIVAYLLDQDRVSFPASCKGVNCGRNDGSHSAECVAEHEFHCDPFKYLMASFEKKRKEKREARSLKGVVPPIGAAAMMRIAGKAMEGLGS